MSVGLHSYSRSLNFDVLFLAWSHGPWRRLSPHRNFTPMLPSMLLQSVRSRLRVYFSWTSHSWLPDGFHNAWLFLSLCISTTASNWRSSFSGSSYWADVSRTFTMESKPIEKISSSNTVEEVVSNNTPAPSERNAWKSVVLVATCTLAMITNVRIYCLPNLTYRFWYFLVSSLGCII